jgi:glycine cleavage system aminomethyltransferase T
MGGFVTPGVFTNTKDEAMLSRKAAYIHGGLNPSLIYRITGPDALRLLSEHSVNSFAKWNTGAAKHVIMCNDDGLIMTHGVTIRLGEDDFMTFWLMPWVNFLAESGDYDVKGENLTGKVFLFQIGGPRALEVLEAATQDDLHHIRYMRSGPTKIAGADVSVATDVTVLRVGMTGALAYEVHGPIEQAQEVYKAILKAGEPFGLQRIGSAHDTHTENGFSQGYMHFLHPWYEDPKIAKPLAAFGRPSEPPPMRGSAEPDIRLRYRNPIEVGWGHMIKFDHEFQGKAALEREVANPKRKMVTLVWNDEDILDVYRSQFEQGEEYRFMPFDRSEGGDHADLVLKDGKTVGLSSGRIFSYYYRKMISLCSIDVAEGEIGNEVIIVWGDRGTRQKEIRATVDRFPFYNEDRNEIVDVNAIPRPVAAHK